MSLLNLSQHIEDGLCIDLYDHTNMGGPGDNIPICGETIASACGNTGDGSIYANNPYDCKDCGNITIYGFTYNLQLATASPACQAVFTIPEDYGDAYYNGDGRLYDAFGK